MKIVVDAMGGDFAPVETVKGAVEAARDFGIEIILTGDEKKITEVLLKHETENTPVSIIHAPEVIAMGEAPVAALRKKKNSSIMAAVRMVKEGNADAVVSAGNTGAAMGAALLGLGRIKEINRPAIAGVIPTIRGRSLIVDVGANAECDPRNLQQFAVMGHIYANKILGAARPKVGLLNIGEEETKGNPLYLEAYKLIRETGLNFVGNIEGRDITSGTADVIICDGFVGNIVLKFGEGLAKDLMSMLKEEFRKNIFVKIGAALVFTQAKELRKKLDYAESGGAPLLGVNGVSIISHGSSDAKAIKNAIRVAKECVEMNIVDCIKESIPRNRNGDDDSANANG